MMNGIEVGFIKERIELLKKDAEEFKLRYNVAMSTAQSLEKMLEDYYQSIKKNSEKKEESEK